MRTCCAPPSPPSRLPSTRCVPWPPPSHTLPGPIPLHSPAALRPRRRQQGARHASILPAPCISLGPLPSPPQVDFLPQYSAFLRDLIKKGVANKDGYHFPLAGFHIVVDAGNGSGGFFADQVRGLRSKTRFLTNPQLLLSTEGPHCSSPFSSLPLALPHH